MDRLPEELLGEIISFCGSLKPDPIGLEKVPDFQTLFALSLVSKDFNRITTPHLYHTVLIKYVCDRRSNLFSWIDALARKEGLAKLVKAVHVTTGNGKLVKSPYLFEAGYLLEFLASMRPLHQLLSTCKNIKHFDMSDNIYPDCRDDPLQVNEPVQVNDYQTLTSLALNINFCDWYRMWPVLRLPLIETLELRGRFPAMRRPVKDIKELSNTSSPIKHLILRDSCPGIPHLARICGGLESLKIVGRVNRCWQRAFLDEYQSHLTNGNVKTLEIWAYKGDIGFQGADYHHWDRCDEAVTAFRNSETVEHIKLDLEMLIECPEGDDIQLVENDPGFYMMTWAFDPNRHRAALLDLNLPKSAKVICLRDNHARYFVVKAMEKVLTALSANVRQRFPALKQLVIESKSKWLLSVLLKLKPKFATEGVELVAMDLKERVIKVMEEVKEPVRREADTVQLIRSLGLIEGITYSADPDDLGAYN